MKRLFFALLVIATTNLWADSIKPKIAGDGVTNYYAVICGISTYKYINNLNYCDDDARGVRSVLLASSNWTSSHITMLVNSAATKGAIKSAIQRMSRVCDEDDVFLFVFSGHGGQGDDDVDPYDESDGYDEYMCPYDSSNYSWNNDIRDDEFSDWISGLRTSNYIIILDTCFAGGQIRGLGTSDSKRIGRAISKGITNAGSKKGDGFAADLARAAGSKDLQDVGRGVILAASQADEDSWEEPSMGHGLFTYYLLAAMEGAADYDVDNLISAQDCFDYASPLVTNYEPEQHPQLYDTLSGPLDFINFNPIVSKCTVTAGAKPNTDKISFSGKLSATSYDLYSTDTITITIDSDYMDPNVLTFPINGTTFKNYKYSYSGTELGIKKSFKYDTATGIFSFSAGNLDLSGLGCPLTADIQIDTYGGTNNVGETIVNAKKPIPIVLKMNIINSLRVDKVTLRRGATILNSDQLKITGGFSCASVADSNFAANSFYIDIGGQGFTIPAAILKANKKGDRFTCSNYKLYDGDSTLIATISADFNFKTGAFSLMIKNTDFIAGTGTANLYMESGFFNANADIMLP